METKVGEVASDASDEMVVAMAIRVGAILDLRSPGWVQGSGRR